MSKRSNVFMYTQLTEGNQCDDRVSLYEVQLSFEVCSDIEKKNSTRRDSDSLLLGCSVLWMWAYSLRCSPLLCRQRVFVCRAAQKKKDTAEKGPKKLSF